MKTETTAIDAVTRLGEAATNETPLILNPDEAKALLLYLTALIERSQGLNNALAAVLKEAVEE